jgi:TRAP-type C4-dicarboxylate transport system substrate-binding protein
MMGNPVFVDTMNLLGGNGVAMGFDQLVNAMQTGVVDGAENNEPSYERATSTVMPSTTRSPDT